jgi:hypothetical protein
MGAVDRVRARLPGCAHQVTHPLGEDVHAGARVTRRAHQQVPQLSGQAVVQRAAANRLDVEPVPLQARIGCLVALVHRDRHAGLAQALGEAQPADARTDDQDSWLRSGHRDFLRVEGG